MNREKMIKKLDRFCGKQVDCGRCPLHPCRGWPQSSDTTLKENMKIAGLLKKKEKVIKIKYFDKEIDKIIKFKVGDWLDLRSAEDVKLACGEYKRIRLGVGMILPEGYEAHILPRSSTPEKFGIMCANSMGVIDNSYSGDADEWQFPAVALWDTEIKKGDRIAQFRIVKNQPDIKFLFVDKLNDKSRGGIGSTGKR